MMVLGSWCSSGNNGGVCLGSGGGGSSSSNRGYDRFVWYNFREVSGSRSRGRLWTQLWRKMKKERKRIFDDNRSIISSSMRFSYDPYTYAQNFDSSSLCADPDDLSRSFSARFAAVPSRIFDGKDGIILV